MNLINNTERAVTKELFPSAVHAENWLKKHPASEDNETSKIALDIVNEKNKTLHFIQKWNGSLKGAAVDMAASNDDQLGRQLKVIIGSGAHVPHALEGQLLNNFVNSRAIQELPYDNPIRQKAETEMADFYDTYPELMYTNLAGKIAKGRDEYGYNNAFANFPGKYSNYKVVERLDKEGKLTPQEKDFYINVMHPLGGLIDIPTPGLLESGLKSIGKSIEDLPKSVYELPLLRNALFNKGEILSRDIEEELAKTPEPEFKGWHKLTHAAGNLAGVVIPIGGEAKVLQETNLIRKGVLANKIATGLTFYHDIEKSERAKNPENPSF